MVLLFVCSFWFLFCYPGKKPKKKPKKKQIEKAKKKQQKCKGTSPFFSHFFSFFSFFFTPCISLLFCFCVFWIFLVCFLVFPFFLHFSRFFSSFKKLRISGGLVNLKLWKISFKNHQIN
jgi:hypothetical protein